MLKLVSVVLAMSAAVWALKFYSPRVNSLGNPLFAVHEGLLYYNSRLFTGTQVESFPDGRVYKETPYELGLKEGESSEYATTGARVARWHYHNGKKDGLQEGWFIEGPKKFEQNYKNGILEGVVTEWHLNGNVFRRQVYADGVEVANKTLFPTSEVYSNYVKKDGRIFGLNGGPLCFEKKKDGER